MKKYCIGIDIGASHIGIGIVDSDMGKIILKKYFACNEINGNEERFTKEVCNAINDILSLSNLNKDAIDKIGIGCPGDCDVKRGVLLKAPNLNLTKVHIKRIVENKFKITTFIENDATCALLGEYYFGKLKEKTEGIMIVVGTGLGVAGFTYKKKLKCFDIHYCNSLANIFKDGYDFRTFNSGSLAYLQDMYISKLKEKNFDYRNVDRKKIFEDVFYKNKIAENVLNLYLDEFAKGICNLYKKTKIKTYCIGGGISEYSKIFSDSLKMRLPDIEISFAKNQNNSAIIGASLLK